MSLLGHPDWHRPQGVGGRAVYAAFEQPGRFFAPPVALPVVQDAAGRPAFHLQLVRQDRGTAGLQSFGLLEIRFRPDHDLADARARALAGAVHLRVEPLLLQGGQARLTAPAVLKLPAELQVPHALDAGGTGLAWLLRLAGAEAELLLDSLRRGLAVLQAEALLLADGVAARADNVATLDPAALAAALWQGQDSAPVDTLLARLEAGLTTLPLRLAAAVPDDARADTAQALLDRLGSLFAGWALPAAEDAGATGPCLRLLPGGVPSGQVRLDLQQPVLARRGFLVQADPLGSARSQAFADVEAMLVQRTDAPALRSGWHRVSVALNLPERCIGVLRLGLDITVSPVLPARPQTVKTALVLDPARPMATVDLRLSPDEPLRFDWSTLMVLKAGAIAQTVQGAVQRRDAVGGGAEEAAHLVVGPGAFVARFVVVEAEPSFMQEASVEVRARGLRASGSWAAQGLLSADTASLAVVQPGDVTDAELQVTAVSLASGQRVQAALRPLAPAWIDAFDFPGTGAQQVALRAQFAPGAPDLLIECAPQDRLDDATRRQLLRLSPAVPLATYGYVAHSPFAGGYCWRPAAQPGLPAAAWSAPLVPDRPLVLAVDVLSGGAMAPSSFVILGVELTAVAGDDAGWTYRPTAACLATDANGRPQWTLIQAGPATMLSLTTQWGVDSPTLEAVRSQLARKLGLADAGSLRLQHAEVSVDAVELQLGDGQGQWQPWLRAGSSGMPPYQAAFNAMLTPDQADTVRKAVQGSSGWLRVLYAVTDATPPRRVESHVGQATQAVHVMGRTVAADGTERIYGVSARTDEQTEAHGDSAADNATTAPITRQTVADAADWGLVP